MSRKISNNRSDTALYLCSICLILSCTPAVAQSIDDATQSSEPQEYGEIIVTARKRAETMLDVPVAMSALSSQDLSRYAASDFGGIANQVPGLLVVPVTGGVGGAVALRGVTSSNSNPAIDQAVALNIDGVQIGSANYLRLSQIDLQQIEVLKGPQALFFGKNSPGGVISIRTADPTDQFEASVLAGYELNAREFTGQFTVSGPITENLKARLVVYGNSMDGWMKNLAQEYAGYTFAPKHDRAPHAKEIYARGTLLFTPSTDLDMRVKYGYNKRSSTSPYAIQQRIYCPNGAPQMQGYPGTVECKQDGRATLGTPDPRAEDAYSFLYHGDFGRTEQHLASVETNYRVTPEVIVTSMTGYFRIKDKFNGTASYQSGSPVIAGTYVNRREISQELRLTTNFTDSPLNLTTGAYYQDLDFRQQIPRAFDLYALGTQPAPGLGWSPGDNNFWMDGSTWSGFGQARWDITGHLELAGGVRYTKEKRSLSIATLTSTNATPLNPKIEFDNWSPEATLTFKPNTNLSIFAAYRNGFKSGGYNTGGGSYVPGQKNDYAPEKAKGFELGFKTVQGPLRFNITAYNYKYQDMQVSTFDPVTVTQTVVNAASARIKGVEADVTYRTPLDGLSLRGSANYNRARYLDFLVGCYTGQTVAAGCNVNQNPITGNYQQQDFHNRQLMLAPTWTGNAGFTYDTPLGSALKLSLTGDLTFSSGFYGQLEQASFVRQESYATVDAGIRIADEDDRVEFALLGRNLGNVYRSRYVSQVSLTGISSRTGSTLDGGLADYTGIVNRGREIRFQIKWNLR